MPYQTTLVLERDGEWKIQQLNTETRTTGNQPQFAYDFIPYYALGPGCGFIVETYNKTYSRVLFYDLNQPENFTEDGTMYFHIAEIGRGNIALEHADMHRAPTQIQLDKQSISNYALMWYYYYNHAAVIVMSHEEYIASQQNLQNLSLQEQNVRYEQYRTNQAELEAQDRIEEVQKEAVLSQIENSADIMKILEAAIQEAKLNKILPTSNVKSDPKEEFDVKEELDVKEEIEEPKTKIVRPEPPKRTVHVPEGSKKISKDKLRIMEKDRFITLLGQAKDPGSLNSIYELMCNSEFFKSGNVKDLSDFFINVTLDINLCEVLMAWCAKAKEYKLLFALLTKVNAYPEHEFALSKKSQNFIRYIQILNNTNFKDDALFASIAAKHAQLIQAKPKPNKRVEKLPTNVNHSEVLQHYLLDLDAININALISKNSATREELLTRLSLYTEGLSYKEIREFLLTLDLTEDESINLARNPTFSLASRVCLLERLMKLKDESYFSVILRATSHLSISSLIENASKDPEYGEFYAAYLAKFSAAQQAWMKKISATLQSKPKSVDELKLTHLHSPYLAEIEMSSHGITCSALQYCLENLDPGFCREFLKISTPNNMYNMLLKVDGEGNNVLHYVFKFKPADTELQHSIIKLFLKANNGKKASILQPNKNGQTFIQAFIAEKGPLTTSQLFELYKMIELNEPALMELLKYIKPKELEELIVHFEPANWDASFLFDCIVNKYRSEYAQDLSFIKTLVTANSPAYLKILLKREPGIIIDESVMLVAIERPNIDPDILEVLVKNMLQKGNITPTLNEKLLANCLFGPYKDLAKFTGLIKGGSDPLFKTELIKGKPEYLPFVIMRLANNASDKQFFSIAEVRDIFKIIMQNEKNAKTLLNHFYYTGETTPAQEELGNIQTNFKGLLELAISLSTEIDPSKNNYLADYLDLLNILMAKDLGIDLNSCKLTLLEHAFLNVDFKQEYAYKIFELIVTRLKENLGEKSIIFMGLMASYTIVEDSNLFERCSRDPVLARYAKIFDFYGPEQGPLLRTFKNIVIYSPAAFEMIFEGFTKLSTGIKTTRTQDLLLNVLNYQIASTIKQYGSVPPQFLPFLQELNLTMSNHWIISKLNTKEMHPLLLLRAAECIVKSENYKEMYKEELEVMCKNVVEANVMLLKDGFQYPTAMQTVAKIKEAIQSAESSRPPKPSSARKLRG